MVTLYRRTGDGLHYWEAWPTDGAVLVHTGRVGERGDTRRVAVPAGGSAAAVVAQSASEAQASGFTEAAADAFHEVVVQFILDAEDIGSEAENLEFLGGLQRQLSDCLAWTGNGRCTDAEMGVKELDTLNLFCRAVAPEAAVVSLAKHLEEFGYGGEFRIGQRLGAEMQTVYPEDCREDEWLW